LDDDFAKRTLRRRRRRRRAKAGNTTKSAFVRGAVGILFL
tara:strand:+ start:478 stop:597 length:120 start_codon:yes stop_codon:yes gene_type:complete